MISQQGNRDFFPNQTLIAVGIFLFCFCSGTVRIVIMFVVATGTTWAGSVGQCYSTDVCGYSKLQGVLLLSLSFLDAYDPISLSFFDIYGTETSVEICVLIEKR